MSEETYEINIDYADGRKPVRYKAKEEDGVLYLYGYHSAWKGWRIVAIRFDKLKFKTVQAVEQYLNEKLKTKIIRQINDGIWNSKLQSELIVLLSISEAKLRNATIPKHTWEY
jgi:hypothetical protein